MKKYIGYTVVLIVGLLLGWILFGNSSSNEATHKHDKVSETNQMWTCSMHPQIMQPEAGDCPICGMDLIPAEANADGLAANQFKLTENAMALANIQTTVVGKRNTEDNAIKLSGKIAENEESNAVQTAHFAGRIEKLYINSEGEKVKRGQLLARIYSPELFAAQQELITAASLKKTQPALYKAVRGKLKLWKLSEKQINSIESSGKPIPNFPVYANVSGVVTIKMVEEGNHVMEGAPLLKIANLNTVWANFDVYENQISIFKKGQDVVVSTNAYSNKTFKGKVDFIDPVLNTKTRTVNLRVVLNNKDEIFKPGMFVTAKVNGINKKNKQTVTIPASAVLWTGERSVVYIKTNPDQPVFEMQEITLGNQIGDKYEVLDGLFVGNEIVTNGTFTVDAAAQLQGKKSMMNKNGSKTMTGHEGHLGMDNNLSNNESNNLRINERLEVPKKFQEQLKTVFNKYINLKDALIQEDSKNTSEAAISLLNAMGKVDMKLLPDTKGHKQWMLLERDIKSSATSISEISDIKVQRNHFKHLSSHLAKAIEIFGINEKVYHQYCPMADGDRGAYWLSKHKKVINPYFGKTMLTCGEVKQVIE